jgi:hypothetical protein
MEASISAGADQGSDKQTVYRVVLDELTAGISILLAIAFARRDPQNYGPTQQRAEFKPSGFHDSACIPL